MKQPCSATAAHEVLDLGILVRFQAGLYMNMSTQVELRGVMAPSVKVGQGQDVVEKCGERLTRSGRMAAVYRVVS